MYLESAISNLVTWGEDSPFLDRAFDSILRDFKESPAEVYREAKRQNYSVAERFAAYCKARQIEI